VTTIYEAAGGMEVFERLAEATHERCLADDLLNHPFSHATNHPEHTGRLAAYWAEALGGPAAYTASLGGSESHVQRLHAGEGAYMEEAGPRFVRCVVDSFDEAGVPDDPRLRQAITDYVSWSASGPYLAWPDSEDDVPGDLPMPRWGWDGPVPPPAVTPG
jgi:hemoglobin